MSLAWEIMDNAIAYVHAPPKDVAIHQLVLSHQTTSLQLFCYRNGLSLLQIYMDAGSEQPELERLMSRARQNKLRGVEYLLIYNWESISDNTGPVFDLVDLFYEKGIDVRPITDWHLETELSWLYRFKTGDKAKVDALKAENINWIKF